MFEYKQDAHEITLFYPATIPYNPIRRKSILVCAAYYVCI